MHTYINTHTHTVQLIQTRTSLLGPKRPQRNHRVRAASRPGLVHMHMHIRMANTRPSTEQGRMGFYSISGLLQGPAVTCCRRITGSRVAREVPERAWLATCAVFFARRQRGKWFAVLTQRTLYMERWRRGSGADAVASAASPHASRRRLDCSRVRAAARPSQAWYVRGRVGNTSA
jgi:hypothetical protein